MSCGDCEGCTMDMPKTGTSEFCNHELHVTVHRPRGTTLSDFVRTCEMLGVDAVAMQFVGGLDGVEWMTRESFHGSDRSARLALAATGSHLSKNGLDPIRVKIESAPWHPLAPAYCRDPRPRSSYYESHMGVWLLDEEIERALAAAHPLSVYLSRNLRKGPRADGRLRYSVTLRSVSAGRYEQETAASLLRDSLRARGLDADSKVRTEWTWLDHAMDPDMAGGPPLL